MRLAKLLAPAAVAAMTAACFATLPARAEKPVPAAAIELSTANNQFGFELLKRLHKDGENTFISPTSIGMALQMTSRGAKGDTLAEMNQTMHVEKLAVGDANRALIGALSGRDDVKLKIGNSIWADPAKLNLNREFADTVESEFDAEISSVSFADSGTKDRINTWVSDATEKKIPKLIEDLDAATVCVLVNAIYFKGDWTVKFDKEKTAKADFTLADGSKLPVMMMHSARKGEWRYTDNDDVQVVALPYGPAGDPEVPGTEPKVHMWLVVPKAGKTLDDVVSGMTSEKFAALRIAAYHRPGTIALPRFAMKFKKELQDDLPAMGMKSAFDSSKADFSGFEDQPAGRGKLFISRVIHEAVIELDEEGTEAAAATAVVMERGSAPRNFTVTCDKPFLLAITDEKTGSVMFVGTVYKPDSK